MIQFHGRSWGSSWGCFQALILIITIFLSSTSAYYLDNIDILNIDILKELNLSNLTSGVSLTAGHHPDKPAYQLHKGVRTLELAHSTSGYNKTTKLLHQHPEFTLSALVRQKENNTGTIIAFTNSININSLSYLEFQSSGPKGELIFRFTHILHGEPRVEEVVFHFNIADNLWHKVLLIVSGREMRLVVDCKQISTQTSDFSPERNFSASNMSIFIGQRNFNRTLFVGDIQDLRIHFGRYSFIKECPNLDTTCPTCFQMSLLENTIVQLQYNLTQLLQRLEVAENRVSRLEECDCHNTCKVNGTRKEDGEEWKFGCDTCTCVLGKIVCAVKCPILNCTNPVHSENECCPKCLNNCYFKNVLYQHGETRTIDCDNCHCIDGNVNCTKSECSTVPLTCPIEQQINDTETCCQICKGEDYCAKGHACHTNATCFNFNTKYTCTCRQGFQGDGFNCSDIDECSQKGDIDGNHCRQNTKCVNKIGSYTCECLPGYQRQTSFSCAEINECQTGEHKCHKNADCVNTEGSYHCQCKEQYTGNGYDCKPVCNHTCLNGGQCLSPNVCGCRMGFYGDYCEHDIDECATEQHSCKSSAICINMPGWYYCKCKPGYSTRGSECHDIDECFHQTHSCHRNATCVNTDGHFECHCPENLDKNCQLNCMFEDREITDGSIVSPVNQPCITCKCNKGVISCEENPCNCLTYSREKDLNCCPQCDENESCQHQELPHVYFKSGEKWIYNCEKCECLYGEFDCWKLECPPLTCENPLQLASGECCPRCPDDPCNIISNTTDSGKPCSYKGHNYLSGQLFIDSSNRCTTCACKDGRLSCSFVTNCTNNELLKTTNNALTTGSTKTNYYNSSSKTTTTKAYHHNNNNNNKHKTATRKYRRSTTALARKVGG